MSDVVFLDVDFYVFDEGIDRGGEEVGESGGEGDRKGGGVEDEVNVCWEREGRGSNGRKEREEIGIIKNKSLNEKRKIPSSSKTILSSSHPFLRPRHNPSPPPSPPSLLLIFEVR